MLSSQNKAQVAGCNDWGVHAEQEVVEGVGMGLGEVAVGEVAVGEDEGWVVVGEEGAEAKEEAEGNVGVVMFAELQA